MKYGGIDDETQTLAEYRRRDTIESEEGDTMFLKYGDFDVVEIDWYRNALSIFVENN